MENNLLKFYKTCFLLTIYNDCIRYVKILAKDFWNNTYNTYNNSVMRNRRVYRNRQELTNISNNQMDGSSEMWVIPRITWYDLY